MAEIQVSNVKDHNEHYDATATTNDVFPNMIDHVEVIICAGDQAGKVTYEGEAAWARSVYPFLMAELDDAVLTAASAEQTATIEWSDIDSLVEG